MIKVGIIGGAGYTAGELLRILIHHPGVDISFVHSNSNAGNPITSVHTDLFGETNIQFTDQLSAAVDVVFLCMGHGKSIEFLEKHPDFLNVKVVDLSTDFRHNEKAHFKGKEFIYGLPELNLGKIKSASHIANPGCFATCIQLAILPLAKAGVLSGGIHVNAITGSTGAGQNPSATGHFSWRNNNVSVYKAFDHQHLQEITESVVSLQSDFKKPINFIPVRGNFTRGIMATTYTKFEGSLEEATAIYQNFYKDSAFTYLVKDNPDLKQVVNTNKGLVYLEKHDNKLFIISMIDNLLKGASGQAVQNMNLMFEQDEKTGLNLKGVGF